MVIAAAKAIRRENPELPVVLGGISPIDPHFIELLGSYGVLDAVDVVAVHGFPLDWNHWQIHDWPKKIDEIRAVTRKPIWVSEAGVSSFGAEEVQVFGLQRTAELLLACSSSACTGTACWTCLPRGPRPRATRKPRAARTIAITTWDCCVKMARPSWPRNRFLRGMGICQWFHYEDPRLELAVEWLKRLGVKYLRTGISWADWFRPNAEAWFDRQMRALEPFATTLTLCFTPEHMGVAPHYTSPPRRAEDFVEFAVWSVRRYAAARKSNEVLIGAS